MTKRILLIVTNSELGGAQTHLLTLVSHLASKYDFSVLVGSDGPLVQTLVERGIPVLFVPGLGRTLNPYSMLRSMWWLVRFLKSSRPSLVHAHSSNAGLVARCAAAICKVPAVFTAHGWGFKAGVPPFRRVFVYLSELIATPLTRRIICVSRSELTLAYRCLPGPKNRFTHIANGIADSPYRCKPRSAPPIIVMVARFQEPKDQALLLRAFARIKRPARLMFVGDGPEMDAVRALSTSLGQGDSVVFHGSRKDVAPLLADCQIFALISKHEGFPISVLEAMRAGLPVLASAVGGIPEQVKDGVTGLLIRSHSEAEVSAALDLLVSSPELRDRFGEAARDKYQRRFGAHRMIEAVTQVYEEVADHQ
jgi:glycosyltransferase involved in cell wall biosynthesis